MPRHPRKTLTKDEFESLYVGERLTFDQIVDRTGVPRTSLCRWKRLWDIPTLGRTESYVGKRFGLWTVLDEVHGGSRGVQSRCRCRCACGTERFVSRGNLQQGFTESCGCVSLGAPGQAGLNKLIDGFRRGAVKRGLAFALTPSEVATLTKQVCHYCGAAPNQIRRERSERSVYVYNGLDRKDNAQGYTPGNAVPCCWECNRGKAGLGYDTFLSWVGRIHLPVFSMPSELPAFDPCAREPKSAYRSKAKQRGLVYNLSDGQLFALFQAPCAYCGSPPSNHREGWAYSGIDRVDNDVGYEPENCVPACQPCNHAKLDRTVTDFVGWAERVRRYASETSTR